jgi:hypothetical protein
MIWVLTWGRVRLFSISLTHIQTRAGTRVSAWQVRVYAWYLSKTESDYDGTMQYLALYYN